ncbi:hypothetical protein B1M_14656 [Burkholderia sp. TJI49]|nr:hypothetical protein B1M_14656 [Burkholderia sp. TJI49]
MMGISVCLSSFWRLSAAAFAESAASCAAGEFPARQLKFPWR